MRRYCRCDAPNRQYTALCMALRLDEDEWADVAGAG
jgi:hypothetical protein